MVLYIYFRPDRYGLKPKYKEYGKNLGRAMVTVHYPQPFFDKNPFAEASNIKQGPTYVRPKDKDKIKIIHPGYILPTGPGKTVNTFNKISKTFLGQSCSKEDVTMAVLINFQSINQINMVYA